MSVHVRSATAADLPALVGFIVAEGREAEARTLDPAVVTAALTTALHEPSLARYWVLIENDTTIGAIGIGREWSDWQNAAYVWILLVYLVPAARGRGLVSTLIDHAVAVARRERAPELRLYVNPDNRPAVRAYERLGFAPSAYRIFTRRVPAADRGAGDELDDDRLWVAFHDRTLPHASWTHAAHLRIAWMHLSRYGIDEAHLRMRVGIIRLNAAHGLVESPARGYHETLTRVWLALVAAARRRDAGADSRGFIAAHALDRDAPLRHYSRERLFSLEARTMYVPPDLAALPVV